MITFYPSTLEGNITIPSSKSYTHRFLIACALTFYTTGTISVFYHPLICEDTFYTLIALRTLGFDIEYDNKKDAVTCKGFKKKEQNIHISCGESASTLRFLIPLSLYIYDKVEYSCKNQLFLKRGINGYYSFFKDNNINYLFNKDYSLLTLYKLDKEQQLIIPSTLDNLTSSQYITGLLFIMPMLNNQKIYFSDKIVSKSYVDITLDVLSSSKIKFEKNQNNITVYQSKYYLDPVSVEGDYSLAALYFCLNNINKDNNIKILNLKEDSFQPDRRIVSLINQIKEKENSIIDIDDNIDLGPVLFMFAAIINTTTFINIERLKIKESNRLQEMMNIFNTLDIEYEYIPNKYFKVYKSIIQKCDEVFISTDHRITHALILLFSIYGGKIKDISNLEKSCPSLIFDLIKLKYHTIKNIE